MASDIVYYDADAGASELAKRLQGVIRRRNLADYGTVDHRHDMQARGVVAAPEAYTVIFGNPVAGAEFLAVALSCAADMPVRVGIYQEQGHGVVAYHRMSVTLAAHHDDLREAGAKVDDLVDSLCQEIGARRRS